MLSPGGTAIVANGSVTANGASLLNGLGTVGSGRTLDFAATFTGMNQAVGLGAGSLTSPLAVFVVKADGNLYARTIAPNLNGVVKTTETLMAGIDWLNKPHQYTIVWNATSAAFKVDGTAMASHGNNQWGTLGMGPMILDSTAGDAAVSVDWMRLPPYATAGTYSMVFDAGVSATWQKLMSTLATPVGTSATISYRVGDSATPDATWSALAPLTGSAGPLAGTGRYIQFTVQLSTTDPSKAPTLKDVTIAYRLP